MNIEDVKPNLRQKDFKRRGIDNATNATLILFQITSLMATTTTTFQDLSQEVDYYVSEPIELQSQNISSPFKKNIIRELLINDEVTFDMYKDDAPLQLKVAKKVKVKIGKIIPMTLEPIEDANGFV